MTFFIENFLLNVLNSISKKMAFLRNKGRKMKMKEKIKTIIGECISGIYSMFEEALNQKSFVFAVKKTKNLTDNLGARILETLCERADFIFETQRDKHQVTIKDRSKTRRLITELGEITLHRVCYFDKRRGKRFFAVDDMLGIEKRSRVEQGLQAKLIEQATLTSFGKSSAAVNNAVSRQTVYNLTKKLKSVETKSHSKRREVQDIYIEADEDHIHLQNGKSTEVKLIYVHDGVKTICKDRTQLENVRYFVSVDDDPDKIWNDVAQYVHQNYSMRNSRIHISGDGAYWIKYGQRIFHKAQYHIDKFHIQKSATIVAKGNKKVRSKILLAMRQQDSKSLKAIFQEQYFKYIERTERRTITEQYFYLLNNIDTYGIKNRCSAEGHVSHILSARMSSRPMGWSKIGAEKIAKLRAYYFNGGDFLDLIRNGKTTMENMQEIYTNRFKSKNNIVKTNTSSSAYEPYRVVGIEGHLTPISRILRGLLK